MKKFSLAKAGSFTFVEFEDADGAGGCTGAPTGAGAITGAGVGAGAGALVGALVGAPAGEFAAVSGLCLIKLLEQFVMLNMLIKIIKNANVYVLDMFV